MNGNAIYSLTGKTAIVTGASSGIGRGIAIALAQAGAHVIAAARTVEQLEETCREIERTGGSALAVPADVTRQSDIENMAKAAVRKFGRIDILVNNAGGPVGSSFKRAPIAELTEQDFDGCIALNYKSVFMCSKSVYPTMMEQKKGAIINISSLAGTESWTPMAGRSLYASSKAAVGMLTRCMAMEWGPYLRVNCVVPGMIETPRVRSLRSDHRAALTVNSIAMGRPGLPEDVAAAVVFLASDAAGWITGASLDVHGGLKSLLPQD